MVKKLLEEKKINARVVTVSGKTVESLYRAKRHNLCNVNAYSALVGLIALLNMQSMKQNAECVMPST